MVPREIITLASLTALSLASIALLLLSPPVAGGDAGKPVAVAHHQAGTPPAPRSPAQRVNLAHAEEQTQGAAPIGANRR